MQIEGVNVKSLRAFRVLRPLRLLSSIPSKKMYTKVKNTKKQSKFLNMMGNEKKVLSTKPGFSVALNN